MEKIRDVFTDLEDSVFEFSLKNESVYYDKENKYFARKSFKKRFLLQNSLYDGILIKQKDIDNNLFGTTIDISNENIMISILPFFIINNKTHIITQDNILSLNEINIALTNNKKIVLFSFIDEKSYKLRGLIMD